MALILNQCERQKEALRVQERDRWAQLTTALREEIEPLTSIMRLREKRALEKDMREKMKGEMGKGR